jgi:putative membrane protein
VNISRQILLLALSGIAHGAQSAEAESAVPEPSIFIEQAAQVGLVDVEAARLALARSQDPGVRSFAQRVLRDQEDLDRELATLANGRGIALPPKLDSTKRSMLDEITAKQGSDFDRAYAQHMAMGQMRAVALFEAASNSPDAAVATFARQSLPALRERQQLAATLAGQSLEGAIPAGR